MAATPKSFLLVDDYPAAVRALKRIITFAGHSATIAGCATTALECMAEQRFDVLITDLDMPIRDGVWLLERVRSEHPTVTRVLSSGADADLQAHVRSGLVQYLLDKPVEPANLRQLFTVSPASTT